MTTQTLTESITCACGKCSCTVDPATAIEKDGQYYCCEACANGHADGKGCGKSGCGCGS